MGTGAAAGNADVGVGGLQNEVEEEGDVCVRVVREGFLGEGVNAGSGGGDGGGEGGGGGGSRSEPMYARMEKVECGGAVLSLSVSRDDRFVMANVRPFPVSGRWGGGERRERGRERKTGL